MTLTRQEEVSLLLSRRVQRTLQQTCRQSQRHAQLTRRALGNINPFMGSLLCGVVSPSTLVIATLPETREAS